MTKRLFFFTNWLLFSFSLVSSYQKLKEPYTMEQNLAEKSSSKRFKSDGESKKKQNSDLVLKSPKEKSTNSFYIGFSFALFYVTIYEPLHAYFIPGFVFSILILSLILDSFFDFGLDETGSRFKQFFRYFLMAFFSTSIMICIDLLILVLTKTDPSFRMTSLPGILPYALIFIINLVIISSIAWLVEQNYPYRNKTQIEQFDELYHKAHKLKELKKQIEKMNEQQVKRMSAFIFNK